MKRSTGLVAICLMPLVVTFSAVARTSAVNSDRAAVISSYDAEFGRSEPASGWTGNQETCDVGSTTSAHQQSMLRRVNWYRSQAGLPAVSYASGNTAAAQAAALYQSRSRTLSHYISPGTPCYSEAASTGSAKSNLYLGVSGLRAIDGYMVDPGANNTAVGHRGWILSRTLGDIATGDVEPTGTYLSANALYVVGTTVSAATPRDGFVAWPNAGYFPDAIVPERWSFRPVESVDFSASSVTVTGPNGVVPAVIVHAYQYIVFEVNIAPSVRVDTTYRVAITGASGGRSWNYDVTLVDVNSAPRPTSAVGWGAVTCAPVGTPVYREVFTDPDGDAYTVRFTAGEGDTDNSRFSIDSDGTIRVASDLPVDKKSYRVRYRATDTRGGFSDRTTTLTLTAASESQRPCGVRNVRATRDGQKLTISWTAPVTGSGFTYRVFVNSGKGYCDTSTTSCSTSVPRASKYEIDVYAVLASEWSPRATIVLSHDLSPTTTTVPSRAKSLARSHAYVVITLMKIPTGSRSFVTTGPCRISANKRYLVTKSTKGTCTVRAITTRKKNGVTNRTTTRATFKVV